LGESLPRANDWADEEILSLLNLCGRLWTETNQTYRRSQVDLVREFGMSAPTAALQHLSSEQRVRLNNALRDTHLSLKDLAGARPWLIGATLEDAGYETYGLIGKSANTVLRARAGERGIPVSSEFAVKDDVFFWFGGMSPIEETQFLSYIVDGILLGKVGMEHISSHWVSGDAAPAAAFVGHVRNSYPELYAKLTLERNRAWLPRLERMLGDTKPTLVVVGLYHLVGPDSILRQAQNGGFTVSKGIRL